VVSATNEEIAEGRIRRSHCPNECGSLSAMGELAACRTRSVQFPILIVLRMVFSENRYTLFRIMRAGS
jgi:hypothetical protein